MLCLQDKLFFFKLLVVIIIQPIFNAFALSLFSTDFLQASSLNKHLAQDILDAIMDYSQRY